jgi:hypothetical protein
MAFLSFLSLFILTAISDPVLLNLYPPSLFRQYTLTEHIKQVDYDFPAILTHIRHTNEICHYDISHIN